MKIYLWRDCYNDNGGNRPSIFDVSNYQELSKFFELTPALLEEFPSGDRIHMMIFHLGCLIYEYRETIEDLLFKHKEIVCMCTQEILKMDFEIYIENPCALALERED